MAASMDSLLQDHTSPVKRRRQNPISCRFCRDKKLKCDRQSPCSNCSFRALSCSNESKAQPRNESGSSEMTAILERLTRLEERFLDQDTRLSSGANRPELGLTDALKASASLWPLADPNVSHVQDAPGKHKDIDCYEMPSSEYSKAVKSLEDTGLRGDPWLPTDAINIEVRVATVQHIALVNSDPALRELLVNKPTLSCTLPSKSEAVLLLDYYRHYLEDLLPILHIPTVQEHLNNCYADLSMARQVNTSILVLLLSIFASASTLMSHHPGDNPPPFSPSDSTYLSAYWAGCALDMMKYHHNRSCEMLEVIQATIILGFLLLDIEGFSARVHSYFTINVSRARDLSLHKIDKPGYCTPRNTIDTEIKRRVWWHIVTADWILSLAGGPQESTYSVQPRQMAVNMPQNIDAGDLIRTDSPMDRPLSVPTTMSYSIQRIKLANLCREAIDLIPISVFDASKLDYKQVVALDQRFLVFLEEIPIFLRSDEQSIQQSEHVVARYPQMRVQRQALSMLTHTRRCKLHQPFLIRGLVDSLYSYSRIASLKSARAVLELKRRIETSDMTNLPHNRYRLSSSYVIYHTFMATVVLVMDLCFKKKFSVDHGKSNSVDNDDDETRVTKAEVMEACRSLHRDQSTAGLGTAYLASLMDVLRKYRVKLRPPNTECIENNATIQPRNTTDVSHRMQSNLPRLPSGGFSDSIQNPTRVMSHLNPPIPHSQQPVTASTNTYNPSPSAQQTAGLTVMAESQSWLADFDIWNSYIELGPDLEIPQWDNLLLDLGPGLA